MAGNGPLTFIKKAWLPLLIVVVVAAAGIIVARTRTFFGADGVTVTPRNFADDPEPFDPKVVKYEIFGTGTYADVNYLDLDAKPQRADGAALPWSLTLQTTAPSAAPNIVAQGDGSSITCRITVDDEVKDERTSSGLNAQTFCFVKSA
jgi:Mycobacterium membrane protein